MLSKVTVWLTHRINLLSKLVASNQGIQYSSIRGCLISLKELFLKDLLNRRVLIVLILIDIDHRRDKNVVEDGAGGQEKW
jgi:hypothetical protein